MLASTIQPFWQSYALYLIVILLMLGLGLGQPYSSHWLQFDRMQIDAGQWWRVFSANWVHLSTNHLLGNALGMMLFAYVAGRYLNNRVGVLLLFWCCLWVGTGLYFYADYLQRYVGMSGALHGLLLVAPFISNHYSQRMAWLFAIVIIAKTIWEQLPWYDDMAMQGYIGGRVETNSHLLGTISGILFLMIYAGVKRRRKHEHG
ncbi:rhombosortase [Bacterioplanoides sp.]|uniref:rhombosortase n=1 Tax=Bacterioplanoides sp. TaxID=2066072 RepID=UPI003B59E953